ncbi:MAG: GNAT family N-acetyltransferase [Lachnospiraceae bacterium]|nr:GNAT family N-acetyltransferase [Lachnospiraceae bacterium]MBP5222348.1 GNAT family N-acetyltransferase [Lachnospiraceae bacterium]
MNGDSLIAFCILQDYGYHQGYRICAPGCVGTIPEYRRQGIGLGMVQNATQHIKELGYETVLRWNCKGFL